MNKLNTFSKRLKHTLEVQGLTGAQLARMAGTSRQAIQYVLSHEELEYCRSVGEIATELKVSCEWLLTGNPVFTLPQIEKSYYAAVLPPTERHGGEHALWAQIEENLLLTIKDSLT